VNHASLEQLIPESAPDFSQPLGLLRACHEKIRTHCQLLVDLCTYLESHTADEDARKTCDRIYRYFSISAANHHQDEEQGLFPLLLSSPDLTHEITRLISQLKLEHFEQHKHWIRFESLLKNSDLVTLAIMTNQAKDFQDSYEQHIKLENNQLLPAAEKLLNKSHIQALGQQMKARRQTQET
jgi:iron-sulfur cluster repair protein YtfE (RIC family)